LADRLLFLLTQGSEYDIETAKAYWIEVVLAWHMAEAVMPHEFAARFLEVLTDKQLSALEGTLYEYFLPDIANTVFGTTAFEVSARTVTQPFNYAEVARALAVRRCRQEWLPSYLECAREACFHIHRLNLVEAVHALCCLSRIHMDQNDSVYHTHIGTFLADAHRFLTWTADALNDPRLTWEMHVWNTLWNTTP